MKNKNKSPKSLNVLVMHPLDLNGGLRMIRPETATISGDLSDYQRLVGGDVQVAKFGDYIVYIDQDGLNKGLSPSLLPNLVGTVVVSRTRSRKDIGLFPADIELLMRPFTEA